ncbi:MAG: hypothetical protein KME09_17015 [Pleurocapsa minor HA4230-MV1]|jgi:hypothetical protein|nr:hypothetical protein [Pleurocapsa minor HA4230-MV1]
MLSLFVTVFFVIVFLALAIYAEKIGKEELGKFSLVLDSSLKYPVSPEILKKLILIWQETKISPSNLEFYLKKKYIERTFRVCEMNLTNLETWDLLKIIIKKISPFKIYPLYNNDFKKITLRLEEHLVESFCQSLKEEELWEKIKSFLDSLIGCGIMTSRPIKSFYDIALNNLEKNPSQSKARRLALETGRLYFGWGLLGIVSAQNEIAIQNDINARLPK